MKKGNDDIARERGMHGGEMKNVLVCLTTFLGFALIPITDYLPSPMGSLAGGGCYAAGLEISVSGGGWALGTIDAGSEQTSDQWTVTASSDGTEDIEVRVADAQGWTAGADDSGVNTYDLDTHVPPIVDIIAGDTTWRAAAAGTHPFGLRLKAPSSSTISGPHTLTVTLTASAYAQFTPTPTPTQTSTPMPTPTITPTQTEAQWYATYGPYPGTGDVVKIGALYVASIGDGPGCADGAALIWNAAISWANGLSWLGRTSGWRLPTQTELATICANKASLGSYHADRTWSSTEAGSPPTTWARYVNFAGCSQDYDNKTYGMYVRAVR